MKPSSLFIGRSTADVISVVTTFPEPNAKVTAESHRVSAGGPALNAAIAFSHFGGSATLFSTFGSGVFGGFAAEECSAHGVQVIDRASGVLYDFPVSNIISTSETSLRCVINPPFQPPRFPAPASLALNDKPDIILLDQFEADAVATLAPFLKSLDAPIVLDGGSWKETTPLFLELATIPIVSSHFFPPGCRDRRAIMESLSTGNYGRWAITCGHEGVIYYNDGAMGHIAAIPVEAVDTLGAGDIFHGAFCAAFAQGRGFVSSLEFANVVAAEACKYPGTREWMSVIVEL
jgi:sugar/nucleoside kinase (ribokinase family)